MIELGNQVGKIRDKLFLNAIRADNELSALFSTLDSFFQKKGAKGSALITFAVLGTCGLLNSITQSLEQTNSPFPPGISVQANEPIIGKNSNSGQQCVIPRFGIANVDEFDGFRLTLFDGPCQATNVSPDAVKVIH